MPLELPYFGPIDPTALEERVEVRVPFRGRQLRLDLNFETPTIDPRALAQLGHQLERLEVLHAKNLAAIRRDYAEGSEVRYYITEHLERVTDKALAHADPALPRPLRMLASFYLKRMGFYPQQQKEAIVSDYTVDERDIDDLVVVARELDGTFESLRIES